MILDKIGRTAGRAFEESGRLLTDISHSKTLLGLLAAGGVVKGLSDTVGKSAIHNAMDIAFDNPNADRDVLGSNLTPSILVAQAGLGPVSSLAKDINYQRYGANIGPAVPLVTGAVAGTTGAAVGGALGAFIGKKIGRPFGGAIGGIGGAVLGGLLGATGGVYATGVEPVKYYASKNKQLLNQSPFSRTSLSTADQLNASGDIVLRNA